MNVYPRDIGGLVFLAAIIIALSAGVIVGLFHLVQGVAEWL